MKKKIIQRVAVMQVAASAAGANGRQQKGMNPIITPRVPETVLRQLDHVEWLETFAKAMQMKTRVEMTPMRLGVITRLGFAAEYIKMLRNDIRVLEEKLGNKEMDQPHRGHPPEPDEA